MIPENIVLYLIRRYFCLHALYEAGSGNKTRIILLVESMQKINDILWAKNIFTV